MLIKNILYAIVAAAFLGLGTWAWNTWQEYKALKIEHEKTVHNEQAYKDSSEARFAQLTVISAFVKDIKDQNDSLKSSLISMRTKVKILQDSIKKVGTGHTTIAGDTARVDFKDSSGVAIYTGWTTVDLREKTSRWGMSIVFKPIEAQADLFEDDDGLWKIRTYSRTPGVTLIGITTISPATFEALQKYSPQDPDKHFAANLFGNTTDLYGGLTIKTSREWMFNADYKLVNRQERWIDNLMFGVHYFGF